VTVISDALDAFLRGGTVDGPQAPSEVFSAYGASQREQNTNMARELTGTPPGRLPAKGTAERRSYDTALRNTQRYQRWVRNEPGEKRNPARSRTNLDRLRRGAALRLGRRNAERLAREGLRFQFRSQVRISKDQRLRTWPAGPSGHPVRQSVDGAALREATELWMAGDSMAASEALVEAALQAYGLGGAEAWNFEWADLKW
jgi:hypothetical protein